MFIATWNAKGPLLVLLWVPKQPRQTGQTSGYAEIVSVMIEPDLTVPLFSERPPVSITVWHRAVCLIFGPVVRLWRRRRRRTAEGRLKQLVAKASSAKTRKELEGVLGNPNYALSGSGCEAPDKNGRMILADRVEVYCVSDCVIDLWFSNDKICEIMGCVPFTAWDVASGIIASEDVQRSYEATAP